MASPAFTLTGTLQDIFGNPVQGASVALRLCNFGASVPNITGTPVIARVAYTALVSSTGSFSITLWGNDVISPSGTYYSIAVIDDTGKLLRAIESPLSGAGTSDLSNITAFSPTNPGTFQLSSSVTSLSLVGGGLTGTAVISAAATNGVFSGTPAVVLTGLPTGVTASPSSFNLAMGASQTVTFTATTAAALTTTALTFTGTSGSTVKTVGLSVVVPGSVWAAAAQETVSTFVTVTVGGISVPVYNATVNSLEGGKGVSALCSFDFTGTLPIVVTTISAVVTTGVVRPGALSITPTLTTNSVSWSLTQAGQQFLIINGDETNSSLMVFANGPVVYPTSGIQMVTPGTFTSAPALTGSNTCLYFGPGQYYMAPTTYGVFEISIGSNQSMFLAEGAIIYTNPNISSEVVKLYGNNMSLYGRGIIDGSGREIAVNGYSVATAGNTITFYTSTPVTYKVGHELNFNSFDTTLTGLQNQSGTISSFSATGTYSVTLTGWNSYQLATAGTVAITGTLADPGPDLVTLAGTGSSTTCQNVTFDGFILRGSTGWTLHLQKSGYGVGSNNLFVNNYKQISSRINSDALDLDNVEYAVVTNCFLRSMDDNLCFKTSSSNTALVTSNCSVSNLVIAHQKARAIGFGTETYTTYEALTISDIYVVTSLSGEKTAAIGFLNEDTGVMGVATGSSILIQNVFFDESSGAVISFISNPFATFGHGAIPAPVPITNITLTNIQAPDYTPVHNSPTVLFSAFDNIENPTATWTKGNSYIVVSDATGISPNFPVYDTHPSPDLLLGYVGGTYVAGSTTVPLVTTSGGSTAYTLVTTVQANPHVMMIGSTGAIQNLAFNNVWIGGIQLTAVASYLSIINPTLVTGTTYS